MKTLSTIFKFILVAGFAVFALYACDSSAKKREQYAIEHNCRYDYNDLCYTIDEKPWLFK